MLKKLSKMKKKIEKELDELQKEQSKLIMQRERIVQLEKIVEAKERHETVYIDFILYDDVAGSVLAEPKRLHRAYKDIRKSYGSAYVMTLGGQR